nr:BlaI/MecI/CopY family transcriptional regulator [Streptomyces canus]
MKYKSRNIVGIAHATGIRSLTGTPEKDMRTMSETTAEATELASQYSARVASDLEHNVKEQERLSNEIEALQAQLTALRHDQTVLVNIQQAIGATTVPASEIVATVPASRKKPSTPSGKGRKPAAESRKQATKKSTAKSSSSRAGVPKLVDLVREHLVGLSEPRSAAEVTTSLVKQHPERNIKATVVRTTLEGLVAKNQAERTKQGRAVFYTATEAANRITSVEQTKQSA